MNIFISLFSNIVDSENTEYAIPCFYETIIKDLEKSGNKVFVHITTKFNYLFDEIPKDLLEGIKVFEPDLFIFFNNNFYDVSSYFDCPIVVYEVDTPLYFSNKKYLKSNISRYKFIVSQEESIEILKSEFNVDEKNILKVPFFTEVRAEDVPIKHNISFIGTKFIDIDEKNKNIFSRFMSSCPSEAEIILFKQLMKEFLNDPFIKTEELFSKYNVTSKRILKIFSTSRLMAALCDYYRTKTLSCVADLGLGLYGTNGWIYDRYNEPDVILSYINQKVYSLKHNQDIYNSSKIGININHLQARSGFSWRVCDILASNACLVSEYKPNIEKYFGKANIPMFTNSYEARELCKKLLDNENMRRDIVMASQEIIEKSYRFKYVRREIENFLGMNLSSDESGEVKYIREYMENYTLGEKFFSLKNTRDGSKKVITVLGCKFSVNRKG